MTDSARFIVITVGCLECNFGDSYPFVEARFAALEDAIEHASRRRNGNDLDSFVLDARDASIAWSHEN